MNWRFYFEMRLYVKEHLIPAEESGKEFLNFILEEGKRAKGNLSENMYGKFSFLLHDIVRKEFGFPLNMIAIGFSKDKNSPVIGIFEKEPDGKSYDCCFDEELKEYYIEVDD